MSWQEIFGHDRLINQFRCSVRQGRLPSTFLFVGPPGIGKRTFALTLAQALLCQTNAEEQLEPCGECPSCLQVKSQSHPDLVQISKPKDKNFIPVELLIGDREHRMREGFCYDISLKPFYGGRKVAIIDDADYLNIEGANCLLKTLEEPPPRSMIILIGTSSQRQLPTIRSRCQMVRFQQLPDDILIKLLLREKIASDPQQAESLVALAQGSIQLAREMADPELWEFRNQLFESLRDPNFDTRNLSSILLPFIDQAGKDAPSRRARMRQVISFALEFYRQLTRSLSGTTTFGDDELNQALASIERSWPGDEETAMDCTDRCLKALVHIDANANQATLLECWLDDLAEITRSGHLLSG